MVRQAGKRYNLMLLGFPAGAILVLGSYNSPVLDMTAPLMIVLSLLGSPKDVPTMGETPTDPPCHALPRTNLLHRSIQRLLHASIPLRHLVLVQVHQVSASSTALDSAC